MVGGHRLGKECREAIIVALCLFDFRHFFGGEVGGGSRTHKEQGLGSG